MLQDSGLFHFVDETQNYALTFVYAQPLIRDLALRQGMSAPAFRILRESLLGFVPFISTMKEGETRGFYIDNTDPMFFLKLEMSTEGFCRYVIHPQDIAEDVAQFKGVGRMSVVGPGQTEPYTSIVQLDGVRVLEIFDRFLEVSDQKDAKILISSASDHSLFVHRLPSARHPNQPSLDEYLLKHQLALFQLIDQDYQSVEEIVQGFTKVMTTILLMRRPLAFRCSCSYQNMLHHVALLASQDPELFGEETVLDLKCQYCDQAYQVARGDLPTIH